MSVYVPDPAEYYQKECPYHLQQGDIFQAVPIVTSPASRELIILRSAGDRAYKYPLPQEPVLPLREKVVADAFDEDRPEFVALTVQRLPAVLMTPTCDLERREVWLFSPVKEVPAAQQKDIFLGKALSLFPLFGIPEAGLPDSVIDVGDLRPVHRGAVAQDLRLKSMSREACNSLGEMIVRAQARVWGYAPDELVPEDGHYRCARDNAHHDLPNQALEVVLRKGDKFPQCPNCTWSHKTAQWYQLAKLKRRS